MNITIDQTKRVMINKDIMDMIEVIEKGEDTQVGLFTHLQFLKTSLEEGIGQELDVDMNQFTSFLILLQKIEDVQEAYAIDKTEKLMSLPPEFQVQAVEAEWKTAAENLEKNRKHLTDEQYAEAVAIKAEGLKAMEMFKLMHEREHGK